MFLFNFWWKPHANDFFLLKILLFLSNQDIMLCILFKLDANSFMFLPVISILVSSAKSVNLMDVLLLILESSLLLTF
jgi:hypothetical protein